MIRHKLVIRRLQREIVPRLWLTPKGLIDRDLDYFEGEGRNFDKSFIDDLAKARDDISSKVYKKMLLSFTIFVYLLANFLAISIDIKLPGIELKYIPGVPEGLILFINVMSVANMIQLNAIYNLECVMKYGIDKAFPEEIRQVYRVRYFPNEAYGRYQPGNLPHITPTGVNSFIAINSTVLFLILVVASFIVYFAMHVWLILDLMINPKIPYLSRSIGIYVSIIGLYSIFYFIITRCWMPYNDYTANHELELLDQINPELRAKRSAEIYDRIIDERLRMVEAGYIKRKSDPPI